MKLINYLITGGAGFIGSALIRTLCKEKNVNILNIDKMTYAGNSQSLELIKNNKNYDFKKLDICDQLDMESVFNNFKPDIVFHAAAETHVDRSIDNPINFLNTNILGTAVLLNAALLYWNSLKDKRKENFRFISISTDEVYGSLDEGDFFNEKSRYKPNSPYSASKASSDHLVRAWNRTYGLPTIITNCSNNYGSYQYPEKLIPLIIIKALKLENLPVYGDGNQIRDWLNVYDHVNALITIRKKGRIGHNYNIGGDCQISNLEVVERICKILDNINPIKNKKIISYTELITFVKDRPGHDKRYAVNYSKLKNETSWKPLISFQDGLLETVQWYMGNNDWWKKIISNKYNLTRVGIKNE